MKKYEFEAKTYEEAVNKAINELNTPQEIYKNRSN